MRLIVYIDDILILAGSRERAREHVIGLIYLLENLGFVISKPKCVLEPTQSIEFLGFSVNSVQQELSLPAGKVKKIRTETRHLLENTHITARKLSQLLGRLQAVTRAVPLAPLFYRKLQQALQRVLEQSEQDYSAQLILSTEEKEELEWWWDHLSAWNGKTIMTDKPSVVIESDASTRGWGASCEGARTGGPWSSEERQWHINCLEALAAFHAVKCFVRDKKSITVLLRMDNTTAVAYVNKLGGTVSLRLNIIAKELWLWCMNRDITLVAEHLPGVLNTIADQESRVMRDQSDWMLNPRIFNKIQQIWGPLEVDMFASRQTNQLKRFFSWRPDPEAEALNAFNQNWSNLQARGYANPPWNLVGKVLNRIRQQQVTLVLVAPVWKSQPWYPILLEMLVDFPILLPHMEDLIIPTHLEGVPAVLPHLVEWLISGNVSKTKKFQKRAQSCCSHHGDRSLPNPMTHCSGSGLTGVINGIQIPFQDL